MAGILRRCDAGSYADMCGSERRLAKGVDYWVSKLLQRTRNVAPSSLQGGNTNCKG
jgi:hypothetical protein